MSDWACVFSTSLLYQAHLIQDLLAENEIEAVILNKQDSAYINIGDIEVLVNTNHVIRAKHIIKKLEF